MATNKADEIRAKILSCEDIKTEIIFIEAWGVDVEVRGFTAKKRAEIYRKARTIIPGTKGRQIVDVDLAKLYPEIVVESTYVPGTGELVFKSGDIGELNSKAAGPIAQIADLAVELSGMGQEAIDDAKNGSSSG